ncbi:hypothetical protein GCM10010358_67230 [Streptomyces minutiscleroticus]|uniref:Integrase n=1 Tax=Streptomyces minutiscleroticus TaxID=68238 RepID=A0A918U757_9ACTN|nr:hypothetical protein [Streptomyces minutiscleroticus]GGY04208.1 hypothetical protein GCM10010358_67230 [Streptomyces minutiscleroticus]
MPADPDDPALCPVVRVRAWLEELRRHGITSGPLFRHITRGGTIRPRSGPRGNFLSPDAIGNIVKSRALLAGVKAPGGRAVTAHGLRRGPAQEISEAGGGPDLAGPVETRLPHDPQALHRARPREDGQPPARGPGQGPRIDRCLTTYYLNRHVMIERDAGTVFA